MTGSVQPIETEYAGCLFRSRLEARWAVFFDALGITWHYEEQGYELPSGRYLPDFRLESVAFHGRLDLLCEVKGQLTHEEATRILRAAGELPRTRTGVPCPILLLLGHIPPPGEAWTHVRIDWYPGDHLGLQEVYFRWSAGRDSWEVMPYGDATVFLGSAVDKWTEGMTDDLRTVWLQPCSTLDLVVDGQLANAYRAARSARFEFGQSGATL